MYLFLIYKFAAIDAFRFESARSTFCSKSATSVSILKLIVMSSKNRIRNRTKSAEELSSQWKLQPNCKPVEKLSVNVFKVATALCIKPESKENSFKGSSETLAWVKMALELELPIIPFAEPTYVVATKQKISKLKELKTCLMKNSSAKL